MFGFLRRKPTPESNPPLPDPWDRFARELGPSYRLLRHLSRDHGWNEWLAEERGRQVVVSVWPDWHESAPDSFRRLIREAELYSRLKHPNILPMLNYAQRDGWFWWVRPWVEGRRLDAWLGAPVDPVQVNLWLEQLMEVLEYCHRLEVFHRRFQPDSIWIENGQVRVGSFAFLEEERLVHAGTHNLPSPRFLAPEQIAGGTLSPAANYFSLGAMAFELFTGRRAFEGEEVIPVIFQILQGERPDASELPAPWNERVSKWLELKLDQRQPVLAPTESGPEMLEVLADLQAEGRSVSHNETFTLDPARALEKLGQFRFPDSWEWVVSLCAAASALAAEKLLVDWKQGQLSLVYQGVKLSQAQMADFWLSAYGATQEGRGYLARGLASALTQYGGSVELASSGWKMRTSQVQKEAFRSALVTHLHVRVDCPEPNWGQIRERLQFTLLPISWSGRWQSTIVANQPAPLEGFSLRIDLLEPSNWLAVVDGMSFPLEPSLPEAGRVAVWGPLRLDAERRALLKDENWAQLQPRLKAAVEGAILEFARVPKSLESGPLRLYRKAVQLWGESDELNRFSVAFLQLHGGEKAPSVLAEECFRRVAEWATPPEKFWQLACRSGWFSLLEVDWERALLISQRALAREHARLHWLLQCWLEWEKAEPDVRQMSALFVRFPEQRLDARFDPLLAARLPVDAPGTWLNLLPAHWTQSRRVLRQREANRTEE